MLDIRNVVSVGGTNLNTANDLTVDTELSTTSNNPVTNKAITTAILAKQDVISDLSTIRSGAAAGATAVQPSSLATVATTGNYSDLSGTPGAATTSTLGLVKVDGSTVTISDGVISAASSTPEGVYTQTNLLAGTNISITEVPQPVIDENTLGVWHCDSDLSNAVSGSSYGNLASNTYNALSIEQYKFGTGSYKSFETSGSNALELFTFPSTLFLSDFTVDFWVRMFSSSQNYNSRSLGVTNAGQFLLRNGGMQITPQSGTSKTVSATAGEWYHIAIERNSNTFNFYVNGVLQTTGTSAYTTDSGFYIIGASNNTQPMYLDEIRLSNVARYQGQDFIPFTQPYSATAGEAKYAINNTATGPDLSSYLQNTATGTNALTLLGTASTQENSINIGKNSVVSSSTSGNQLAIGNYAKTENQFAVALGSGDSTTNRTSAASSSVAVGYNAKAYAVGSVVVGCSAVDGGYGNYKTAIGYSSQAGGPSSTALGYNAKVSNSASVENAIQLGAGTNSTANTFQVFSTQVVNASGKIPMASTDITSLTGYDATKTQVLKNVNGTLTWVDDTLTTTGGVNN